MMRAQRGRTLKPCGIVQISMERTAVVITNVGFVIHNRERSAPSSTQRWLLGLHHRLDHVLCLTSLACESPNGALHTSLFFILDLVLAVKVMSSSSNIRMDADM